MNHAQLPSSPSNGIRIGNKRDLGAAVAGFRDLWALAGERADQGCRDIGQTETFVKASI
jgi:hypothetical protein